MKVTLIYAKYVGSLAAFFAFVVFAWRINYKLEPTVSGTERFVLISFAIVGAATLITKANEYLSTRLFPRDR